MSRSRSIGSASLFIGFILFVSGVFSSSESVLSKDEWQVHDMKRPRPPVVAPGKSSSAPPSDAIVLFDGSDLSAWMQGNGQDAHWTLVDDASSGASGESLKAMQVTRGGGIQTRQKFGSCQLHIEWATPKAVSGTGQGRGNSGVFFMGRYEVQVLDSYENETYADGQAASLYGQTPPWVNACRGPGEWQSYDIIFMRPHFNDEGKVTRPATITVLHNGVVVHHDFEIWGATAHKRVATYSRHDDRLPISLQDHGNPVRFRNVWIRPLEGDTPR